LIFGQNRQELRQMYVDAWRKSEAGEVVSPLEAQIAQVVSDHPEYQAMLTPDALEESFTPEDGKTNPFLHMGLHLAIRDQVSTNRPPGIAAVFKDLAAKAGDPHVAEHKMVDCLAQTLWEAQGQNAPPDEQKYIERLRGL
jgi:hypothetical protein